MKKILLFVSLIILTLTLTSCMQNKTISELQEKELVAIMKTTNGVIEIELEPKLATKTTYNFVGLAKKGYYDGIIFHRIISGFMIQGGDPTGTGMGGESIYGEKFDDEFHPDLKNNKYTLSMANAGPNTNGSQFFINVANNNFLDNKHSVFGEVITGDKNVDKLAKVKTGANDKPEKEVKIISLEIKERVNGSLVDFNFDEAAFLEALGKSKKEETEAKKTKKIEAGDVVGVHYIGTFEDGEKFDSSLDRGEALVFEVAAGQMIKGFDEAVVGMQIGDKKTIKLSPEQAYGGAEVVIPKSDLQSFIDAGVKLEAGEVLPTGQGEINIIAANEISITIENNHPMAGKTLNFDIEIMEIR